MQTTLDDFARTIDSRTSLFDVKIDSQLNGSMILSGRVLDASQLDELPRLFPDNELDISSIRILSKKKHERVHVTTNLTGLHERPTFGTPLLNELRFGTELDVLEEQGRWVLVRQLDGYLGWAYRPYLGEGTVFPATHLALAPSVELRTEPNDISELLTRIVAGTGVALEEVRNGWSRVSANKTGWLPSKHLRAIDEMPTTLKDRQFMLESDSHRLIGVPYLWGGASGNGIDCSGFAQLLHRWIGIEIPRDADMQCTAARPVEPPYELGDLFFFAEGENKKEITHVGMSLGRWKMIHSSRSRNGVYVDDVEAAQFLKDIFVSAGSFLR